MKKYSILTILIFVALVFTGCKKYLDVNKNENDPTEVPLSTLLPAAQVSLANSLAMGYGFSNILAVYTHQMTTRESPDQYGILPSEFYLNQGWAEIYENALADLDVIISQGSEDAARSDIYVGMAKILKAYAFSQLVDIFGDVPFSDFNKFPEGVRTPKFDGSSDIYPTLLTMLDEGIASLNGTENATSPTSDDLIYKGDKTKWIKAANTIKLKLYTQMRKVKDVQSEVQALLGTPANLINMTSESFYFLMDH
ncbi:SusD/RagB family nutrient-binding outer membrane lipoprotein [Niabella ginsengisoli]|uniref:SusD/RagB family nutrient-binding outer membrane lipoprotein n=1 Tax=Niabella ginsengisoli TaxID=522298 RepID=A0ABS9SE94_9BACT|nr:SusD/RagB family nutrient-binding outer membrane lipoprotein [Niabella ginsengisoli]MCH5596682.1 SusD/RagB family nutrient-binding outer membrane lipoprotein [Niabella ginsengisoli]